MHKKYLDFISCQSAYMIFLVYPDCKEICIEWKDSAFLLYYSYAYEIAYLVKCDSYFFQDKKPPTEAKGEATEEHPEESDDSSDDDEIISSLLQVGSR